MRHDWKTITCFLAVLGVTTLLGIQGQKPAKHQDEPDVNQFPIVEYNSDKENGKRATKGKKYNRLSAPRVTDSVEGIFTIRDWEVGLPALPVGKSSAVVIGEITDAQAHISEDETNIYSEIGVRIGEVLKYATASPSASVTQLSGQL